MMKLVGDHNPTCRFEVAPEAGDAAFHEEPEVWNKLVLEFMGQHGD